MSHERQRGEAPQSLTGDQHRRGSELVENADQQCVGELADVAGAGDPELGTGALAVPMPWPGEAALGMLELPDIGGALATDPEVVGTVSVGAV